jgi:hypothetical protein
MAYGTRGLAHPVAEDILRKGCTKGNERFTERGDRTASHVRISGGFVNACHQIRQNC